ncbi:MAG TPA: type II toxin-antitoxin system VapC family toxin [Methylococcaceae bacterium]|nr:type II toxin-antitoxin system VapC family toxin [Methylococcaceae bacterium]
MISVLDASALLAFLQDEPGSEIVDAVLSSSRLSTVNWAEVVQKSVARGVDVRGMREDIEALGVAIEPFTVEQAEIASDLWKETKSFGLSLGDRACLALGLQTGATVLTTDTVWENLKLDLNIRILR